MAPHFTAMHLELFNLLPVHDKGQEKVMTLKVI